MSRPIALKAVEIAKKYLYVREKGVNAGKEVEYFQGLCKPPVGANGPWCIAFLRACMKEACTELNLTYDSAFPRTGYTPDWVAFAQDVGIWIPRTALKDNHEVARRGDLAMFYMKTLGRHAHGEIITSSDAEGMDTIGGNTGPEPVNGIINRDGDGVYKKRRDWFELGEWGGIIRINF